MRLTIAVLENSSVTSAPSSVKIYRAANHLLARKKFMLWKDV